MHHLTLLLGILAMLQVLLLPGYLWLRVMHLSMPLLRQMILAVPLSLLTNYIVVVGLVLCGVYTPTSVYLLFAGEVLLLWCLAHQSRQPVQWSEWLARVSACVNAMRPPYLLSKHMVLLAAVITTAAYVAWWVCGLGEIFTQWDPVVSWNMWALDWAGGHLPRFTFHYPQLMPANWSIIYVWLQPVAGHVGLQFFPKAIMPLFVLLGLATCWDLLLTTHRVVYALAVVLMGVLFASVLGHFIGGGWVDGPVAVIAWISVYVLVIARYADSRNQMCWFLLSGLCVAAAVVTKQAGIYIALISPVLAYSILWRGSSGAWWKSLWPWLTVIVLALPWYGHVQWQIQHGLAKSEIAFVTKGLYAELPWYMWRIGAIWFSGFWFWLCVFCALWAWSDRQVGRPLFYWVGLPYTAIWFYWYAYDTRNLALALPFVAVGAAFGVLRLWRGMAESLFGEWCAMQLRTLPRWQWCLLLALLIAVLGQVPIFQGGHLLKQQAQLQRKLDHPITDALLYEYQQAHGLHGKILTNWDFLGHLPGLSQYYLAYQPPGNQTSDPRQAGFMMYPKYLPGVVAKTGARYILVGYYGGLITQSFSQYLNRAERAGKLKRLFHLPEFNFYEIMPGDWPKQ